MGNEYRVTLLIFHACAWRCLRINAHDLSEQNAVKSTAVPVFSMVRSPSDMRSRIMSRVFLILSLVMLCQVCRGSGRRWFVRYCIGRVVLWGLIPTSVLAVETLDRSDQGSVLQERSLAIAPVKPTPVPRFTARLAIVYPHSRSIARATKSCGAKHSRGRCYRA